jgi:proteasome lid subunit RPN8/RPN11
VEATITISKPAYDTLVAHARREAPNECCGLLLGHGSVVTGVVTARNLRATGWRHALAVVLHRMGGGVPPGRVRFLLDPRDHFAAIRAARASDRAVLGIYHSHPATAPVPSDTDRREAAYPDFLYIIVSPGGRTVPADVRAYRLEDGEFRAEKLKVES